MGPDRGRAFCLAVEVSNDGRFTAKAVLQLYLEFPAEAGYPTPILRGFEKTQALKPGDRATAQFQLTHRDLSYYNAKTGSWATPSNLLAHVGESSAHIHASMQLRQNANEQSWSSILE